MNKARVLREVKALRDVCRAVKYDLNNRYVILGDIPFPQEWSPRVGAIRFELPPNYPADIPRAFMPAKMTYRGRSPEIKLDHRGPDGWSAHCIHYGSFKDQWVADRHSMVTLLRMIQQSLKNPNDGDPWR